MIYSWQAFLFTVAIIVLAGFIKALLVPALPYETMVTGVVAICTTYFGKRVVQKMKTFNKNEQVEHEQDV